MTPATTLVAPVQPLAGLLQQMRSMIERMDDDAYTMPAPGRSSGGVGGHVRHCLDHVGALVHATRTGLEPDGIQLSDLQLIMSEE